MGNLGDWRSSNPQRQLECDILKNLHSVAKEVSDCNSNSLNLSFSESNVLSQHSNKQIEELKDQSPFNQIFDSEPSINLNTHISGDYSTFILYIYRESTTWKD